MAEGVRRALAEGAGAPRTLFLNEPDGRRHRVVLSRVERLRLSDDLTVVGFFGQRRKAVELRWDEALERADADLILEFPKYPGVLTYSTLQLQDGDFGDLALMTQPASIEHWSESGAHAYAANEVSPRVFHWVRLHTGLLPGGLASAREIVLTQTKYFDYSSAEPWRAIRDLLDPA